jgi:predicted acetyltransferase
MPELALPDLSFRDSFLTAMAEFADEGRTGDDSAIGHDLQEWIGRWESPEGFAAYVADVRADETDPPAGWVRCTTWWWVEGTEYLGRIALRHELNQNLREVGGHIGYDVRRSRRREGHATRMFAEVLARAGEQGIDPALVTCDLDNAGSRAIIENAGGVLEDERRGKLRYWVPTR